MAKYIYQYNSWPNFEWDEQAIQAILGKIRYLQGKLLGRMSAFGFSVKTETLLSTLTMDILKSSEIEGEKLNYEQVRSSIARKLGLDDQDMIYPSKDVEGVVEMMLDATQNYAQKLDEDRLFAWHAALFPTGRSGLQKIETACYRTGEMQIVSGAMGRERVHYHAPPPEQVKREMDTFLTWLHEENQLDEVVKSAIAHFWFIIIHPFDDGNGRIARAISDLLLARSENNTFRCYSLSNQMLLERKAYYNKLQEVQYSEGDITEWILWFLNCLHRALQATEVTIKKVIRKAGFWERHQTTAMNNRQRLILNKLLDGFVGKLKTSKWAKITKSSQDTALRDIKDLIEKGILQQEAAGGRSTNYELVDWETGTV
ncbi:MAG: Fic family protein [Bacteroidota bacterium]